MKHYGLSVKLPAVILLNLMYLFAYPCTTFVIRQQEKIVFGRNLDWITGSGLIITNPANVKKTALIDPSDNPMTWVSKYGSMTFNQIGRDLPYGGINETGLVVEHMTLEETQYPPKDHRYAISANQWIQFQLDNFSTVEEVLNSDTLIRIVDVTSKYHYLICDRYGNAAAVEFINGKMVSHYQNSLPVPALANSTYSSSVDCYDSEELTGSNRSLYNFCTAAHMVQEHAISSSDSLVEYAFSVLKTVSQGPSTKWSIVYDITDMRVYFRIFETPVIVGNQKIFMKEPGQAEVNYFDLKNFEFDCSNYLKVYNLNDSNPHAIDSLFINYSTDLNKEFITKAFDFFKNWGININLETEQIDYLAKYPESFICMDD